MITHYDLFAGIGGFSLALEEVFHDKKIKHIFCEWESFPTAVLKKNWPEAEYWGDIADLVAHSTGAGLQGQDGGRASGQPGSGEHFTIVTGGFPCQPFSHAGRRRGTEDNRYQWPNMLAIIRATKPEWVIAENVRGLVTWNEGLVLETVCSDLEAEGYQVQPFIIPAVAVGAPHRRDRVWIIGNAKHDGQHGAKDPQGNPAGGDRNTPRPDKLLEPQRADSIRQAAADPDSVGRQKGRGKDRPPKTKVGHQGQHKNERFNVSDWRQSWQEVAFATCDDSMDDGLPRLVDGVPYTFAKWRRDSLKAYGNGIVPQVAVEVMRSIRAAVDELPQAVYSKPQTKGDQ